MAALRSDDDGGGVDEDEVGEDDVGEEEDDETKSLTMATRSSCETPRVKDRESMQMFDQ